MYHDIFFQKRKTYHDEKISYDFIVTRDANPGSTSYCHLSTSWFVRTGQNNLNFNLEYTFCTTPCIVIFICFMNNYTLAISKV